MSYRCRTVQETLNIVKPYMGLYGITRLANITGLDNVGIPVFLAVRPNSRSLSLSQGKGVDPDSAKISALMESVEGYYAERIPVPEEAMSYLGIVSKGLKPVDCRSLPTLNGASFDESRPVFWVHGSNLINKEEFCVPYEIVHTDYRPQNNPALGCFPMGSNGLASGNTSIEADNHALCELIERDAYSCWTIKSTEEQDRTKVNVSSIESSVAKGLIETMQRAGLILGLWDITSDLEVPCFLVRIANEEPPPRCTIRPASGFGCHPDKNLALIRALTEAAQSRLTFIAGGRDDIRLSHYRSFSSPNEHEKWRQAILKNPFRNFKQIKSQELSSAENLHDHIISLLFTHGFKQIISVPISPDSLPFSVTRVIVPGLEGCEGYNVIKPGKRARILSERKSYEPA